MVITVIRDMLREKVCCETGVEGSGVESEVSRVRVVGVGCVGQAHTGEFEFC